MLILGIDTSGLTAACALWQDGEILSEVSFKAKKTHSQVILPLVKKMLLDADKTLSDVDVFAAVKGPGSYTGLRIGIAAVQGLCSGQALRWCQRTGGSCGKHPASSGL